MSETTQTVRLVPFDAKMHEHPDGMWRYYPPTAQAVAIAAGTAIEGACPRNGDEKCTGGVCCFECIMEQVANMERNKRSLMAQSLRFEIQEQRESATFGPLVRDAEDFQPRNTITRLNVPFLTASECPPPGPAARLPRPWQQVAEVGAPRSGNTGAQTPDACLNGELTNCADWLEGDWSVEQMELPEVLHLFSQTAEGRTLEWTALPHPRSGRTIYSRDSVQILDGQDKIYLTVSGQGCRQLEGEKIVLDWQAFAHKLLETGMNVRRFDYAWDDKAGIIPFCELRERLLTAAQNWEDRTFTTRATCSGGIWSGGQGRPFGETLTVGKRGSESYLRFYDRAALLAAKAQQGIKDDAGKGGKHGESGEQSGGTHIRCEMEWRRERARAALLCLAVEGVAGLAGVLRAHIEFKDGRDASTRLERCPVALWWEQFLQCAEKGRLQIEPVVRTLEKGASWIEQQAVPTLAMLALAPGYGLEAVFTLVMGGMSRLRKTHEVIIDRQTRDFRDGNAKTFPGLTPEQLDFAQAMINRATGEIRPREWSDVPDTERFHGPAESPGTFRSSIFSNAPALV